MSTLALMRWLEAAPARYDAGMRMLTLGRATSAQQFVAAVAREGAEVVEIGCGTGALTVRLAERGARVTAIDQSPEMLERARARLRGAGLLERVEIVERTASEIDALPEHRFDAVVATFALSEMSRAERAYVLTAARRCLREGGVLALADEVRPAGRCARMFYGLLRAPQAALGWLLAGSVSRPLPDAAAELRAAGFAVSCERRWLLGSLAGFIAEPATAGECRNG